MNDTKKFSGMRRRLLALAFAEGATVMACELLGAKMTAPFFGTSLYSWAAVLAVTLSGLAAGYYVGGFLSEKKSPINLLRFSLLASGLFLILMPWVASSIMELLAPLPLFAGLLLSMLVFLIPPIFLFGMVSPAIIQALVRDLKDTGKTSGMVYGISTLGGVINTLAMGFWIIPTFGLKTPSMIYGLFIIALTLSLLPLPKKASGWIAMGLILIFGLFTQRSSNTDNDRELFKVLHASEGLLGQVKVVDYYNRMEPYGLLPLRGLLVNNTWQTVVHRGDGTGMLDYTYFLNPLISYFDAGDDALLIGLGGGTIPAMISSRGMTLQAVELDPRLPQLAKRYFGMARNTPVAVDDGRHFLRKDKRQYDLILFDAFLGENPPWHLLTLETFLSVKEKLKPQGLFIIEFYGFLHGSDGMASRSVFQTLTAAGFTVQAIQTGPEPGLESNFIFVCSEKGINLAALDYNQKIYSDKDISNLEMHQTAPELFRAEESIILRDDLPALDRMLMRPAMEWRSSMNGHFRDLLRQDDKPVFY
jgi:predicted membrane-bound spermidine synthase